MTADRLPRRRLRVAGEHLVESHLDDRDPLGDVEPTEHGWVDLADGAHRVLAGLQRRRARGVQTGGHPALVDASTDAERRGDLAPHRHRGRRLLPGQHDAQHLVLVGQVARAGRVDVPDLEQPRVRATVRLVERDRPQQAGPQRRAQHALLVDERVGDADARPVEAGLRERVGGEERVRHRLGDAETEQHLAQPAPTLLQARQATVHRGARHRLADPVVAEVAGDLLDHVDLGVAVGTPRRQRDGAGVTGARDGEADRIEQRRQVVGGEGGAEDPVDLADRAPRPIGAAAAARARWRRPWPGAPRDRGTSRAAARRTGRPRCAVMYGSTPRS